MAGSERNTTSHNNLIQYLLMIKKRVLNGVLILLVVAALLGSGFFYGYKVGRQVPETIIVEEARNLEEGKPEAVDFGTFWQAWKTIDSFSLNYDKTSVQDRLYGAIRGLTGSLGDKYSEFFPPEDSAKFEEDIQGSFGGIGAELGTKDGQLVVVAPLKDTPAEEAGLKAGDQILLVNSSSTAGISIDQSVKWIRGPVGEPVTLTVLREGWERSKEIEIIRAVITIPTLEVEALEGGIVHFQLYSFNGNAPSLFYNEAVKALFGGAKGMILDLRNDPGGYLEVAVDLAGWFVPRGSLVVSQEGRGDSRQEQRANGNEALKDFPLVLLVNGGSASAAEILAGAIKINRDNVKIVGEKTFGKGTVQELQSLRDGSSLKLTVAHWVLPNGKIIEGEGIEPDIVVEITEEDAESKKDPQLEKAVEVLKQQIADSK